MWEVDELSSISKLKSLIKRRFGKGLEISRLTDLNSTNVDSEFFFRKSNLFIPIMHDQTYLGTAIVAQAQDIDKEQLFTLSSLVKMTLTPALYSKYQQLQENNLNVLDEVVSDHFTSEDQSITNRFEKNLTQYTEEKKLLSQVIHLNGIPDIVLKVAHQIHELDNRWGFVPLEDLNIQISDVDDISKLGSMTIFIRDVLALDLEHQKVIAQYLKLHLQQVSSHRPLIIIGSSLKLTEIAESKQIDSNLLVGLDDFTFEVDKAPLSYKKLKEVTELMFFNS